MIEAVDTRAKGLRRPRSESVDLTAFLGRLDWILLGAVAALVGYGLWAIGGITQHDIPGNSGYYVVRQGVYAAIGAVALVAVVFIDPATKTKRPVPEHVRLALGPYLPDLAG